MNTVWVSESTKKISISVEKIASRIDVAGLHMFMSAPKDTTQVYWGTTIGPVESLNICNGSVVSEDLGDEYRTIISSKKSPNFTTKT